MPEAIGAASERLIIRPAQVSDFNEIQAIYALEVAEGTASFELTPPDLAEMTARWQAIRAADLPYLVAERAGQIAGYAYASPYRPRPAYRFSVENSVYVARAARGQAIGTVLLAMLIEQASLIGMRQMIAIIGDSANLASIRLHERAGFAPVGTLRSVGFKFERWLDTVIMQRALAPS